MWASCGQKCKTSSLAQGIVQQVLAAALMPGAACYCLCWPPCLSWHATTSIVDNAVTHQGHECMCVTFDCNFGQCDVRLHGVILSLFCLNSMHQCTVYRCVILTCALLAAMPLVACWRIALLCICSCCFHGASGWHSGFLPALTAYGVRSSVVGP